METFDVLVAHGKESHKVECSAQSTVQLVMQQLEERAGVFVRLQKLIFKGKVLEPKATLSSCKIGAGAKIMLLSKGPLAAAPAAKTQPARPAPASSQPSSTRLKKVEPPVQATGTIADRAKVWRKTGFVSLRDMALTEVPPEALAAASAKVFDATGNRIAGFPPSLGQLLPSLISLRLSNNCLASAAGDAATLAPLALLTTLVLDGNQLSSMEFVCQPALSRLQVLVLARNSITEVPEGVGHLTALRVLDVSSNALTHLPAALGDCLSLVEVDASSNKLAQLPPSLSRLQSLRSLRLNDNSINALPGGLLGGCTALVRLSLGANPITLEALRGSEGFAEYDRRRREKCDKQLDMAVLLDIDSAFQEGADVATWERFSRFNK